MVALLLALWTTADARPLELPDEGLLIRGHDASAQIALVVPPSAAGGTLTLPLTASGIVDRAASEVTVRIDDTVLATASLRQIAQQASLTVPLPEHTDGRHHLTVVTHLAHQTEDCAGHEHPALWVHLLSGAQLAPPDRDPAPAGPLGALQGPDVRIASEQAAEGPWLAALLAADRWVRQQGGLPHWVDEDADADLRIGTGEASRLTGGADVLRLEAATPGDLRDGLVAWMSTTPRPTCAELPCPLPRQTVQREDEPGIVVPSPVAVRLEDLGWRDGWRADGPGWHSLHLRWQTPAGWRLMEPAQLQGTVELSGLQGSRAAVAVYLHGARIHRSLLRDGRTDLAVDLPVPEAGMPLWQLEIAVSLPEDRPDATWRLDPATGLHLSRNQGIAGGMSGFALDLSAAARLGVAAELPLEPPEVGAFGALLADLPPLRLEAPDGPCDAPCISATHDPDGALFRRVERHGTDQWEAQTGSGTVVPARGRPWAHLSGPGQLTLHLPGPGGMDGTLLAPLPWRDLDSTGALAMGRTWFPVGFQPRTAGADILITPRSRHDEAERRQAQLQSAYVDVAMAAVALLALVLLTLFWRNASQRVPALEEL